MKVKTMNVESDILKKLAELEAMAENVEKVANGEPELSSAAPDVDLQPIITPIIEEPSREAQVEGSQEVSQSEPQPAVEHAVFSMSLNPQVVGILKGTSGALDLILMGIQAKIARAGLGEDSEQLGALSMVLANIYSAKSKVDSLLG
jgi:hypothetical protein